MTKIKNKALKLIAGISLMMVTLISTRGCFGPLYTPKLPDNSKELL